MSTQVLVVDDSTMSRKITIRALPPEWDVEVSQLDNGEDAVEACREGNVDVMLLDLTMPGLSGFDVLERIFEFPSPPAVIVISADAQPKAEERAMELGARGFVRKPVDPTMLAATLRDTGIL
ncbi:Stage 0 sporulation protein A [wastewater metagenome]|uniref:Stage 0 sporulation protein A n=2 Tax=unclassified sequences TaxID=12908 RepID=A0A5B8REI3_9ZZZZ|nr:MULTISPECIES: response regulator [Arhodomonas]MCS4505605.1 response regulator [Arhodomonas aquaeolei]QEA07439.1 stage 0 sporulation protein A [uncultured organism]